MGLSEWGFPLVNQENLDAIIQVMQAHNHADLREVGETLTFGGVLRYRDKLYLYLVNEGGRELTEKFLRTHYPGEVFWPFEKPSWWHQCQDYVWTAKSAADQPPSFSELIWLPSRD